MLNTQNMLGFVLTRDVARARDFYQNTLGFAFVSHDPFALVMDTGRNRIRISEVKDAVPAAHTILGWEVDDVPAAAARLRERGVTFARYDWAKQDDLGVWTAPGGDQVAWFRDPDGNLLSISSRAR